MISVITPTNRDKKALELVDKALKQQSFRDFEWIVIRPEKIPSYLCWSLNRDYNKAIRKAKGDLIVSWQDYTYAKPDTLEKFYFHFKNEPKTLVSAVGNKYSDDSFLVEMWKDPRIEEGKTYYEVPFHYIEFNLCSVPKKAFYDVGGFDEELDKWYGMDGYSVVDRLNMIGGYKFKIDNTIRTYSLEHDRPPNWEEKNAIHGAYQERRKFYLVNPKLNYLK